MHLWKYESSRQQTKTSNINCKQNKQDQNRFHNIHVETGGNQRVEILFGIVRCTVHTASILAPFIVTLTWKNAK